MKVATIGTGFIVEDFLKAVDQNEGVTCVAVYSRKEETGRQLADKFHVEKVYTDLDKMLADNEIDFIYIASPNSLHYTYSLKALQAGKNVICEKPFTSTVKEFDELQALAEKKHLYLFEAIITMHMPNYKHVRDQLPKLGNIKMVQANFSQYSSRYDKFLAKENPNVFNPEFSGGALADLNIYNLHFTIGLFGKPNAVHYFPNIADNGIDTSGVAILDYGTFKSVCVGCKDSKSKNLVQIQGEKGYITVDSEASRCVDFTATISNEEQVQGEKQNSVSIYYELKDFIKIYHDQDYEACKKTWIQSRMVMEVFEAARKDGGIIFKADR